MKSPTWFLRARDALENQIWGRLNHNAEHTTDVRVEQTNRFAELWPHSEHV